MQSVAKKKNCTHAQKLYYGHILTN